MTEQDVFARTLLVVIMAVIITIAICSFFESIRTHYALMACLDYPDWCAHKIDRE